MSDNFDKPVFSPEFLKKSFTLVTINIMVSIAPLAARVARSSEEFKSILNDYIEDYRCFLSTPMSEEERALFNQALDAAMNENAQ